MRKTEFATRTLAGTTDIMKTAKSIALSSESRNEKAFENIQDFELKYLPMIMEKLNDRGFKHVKIDVTPISSLAPNNLTPEKASTGISLRIRTTDRESVVAALVRQALVDFTSGVQDPFTKKIIAPAVIDYAVVIMDQDLPITKFQLN